MKEEILLIEMWQNRLIGIEETVASLKIPYKVVRPYTGEVIEQRPYEAIIITGGAPNISEIERHPFLYDVIAFVRYAMRRNIPILGICLGHQVLAAAMGGRVTKARHPEVGFVEIRHASDWILSETTDPLIAFQYHFDEVSELPDEAEVFASSDNAKIQAFKVKDKLCFGVQFHPEMSWERAISILTDRKKALTSMGFNVDQHLKLGSTKYDEQRAKSVIRNYLARVVSRGKIKSRQRIS